MGMPWLTDLATAARKSGLRVVEVAGWKTRGHGPMVGVRGVVCHWTATPETAVGDYPSMRVVRDGRTGLPGPLANLGLGRNGTVYVNAAGLAYHAGQGYWSGIGANGNGYTIGIEAEESGDGRWTAAMLNAYPRLCAALAAHYRIPVSRVIGHHEWAPGRKIDIKNWPGGMTSFRRTVTNPPPPEKTEDGFMAALTEADQQALIWRVYALVNGLSTVPKGPSAGERVVLADQIQLAMEHAERVRQELGSAEWQGLPAKVDALSVKLDQVLAALAAK